MWEQALNTLFESGTVEYGAYQRETRSGTPLWRRPTRGRRFDSVENALFNQHGARNACLVIAPYPRERYPTLKIFLCHMLLLGLGIDPGAFLSGKAHQIPK